jgi:hypothetical protein
VSAKLSLQQVRSYYMDAVVEAGKYLPDGMRLTDTTGSDYAYPSFAERHVD